MAFDALPGWPTTPAFLRLYVDDAEVSQGRALAAGAKEITAVTLLSFGDQVGRIRDPLGNIWWIQSRVEEVSPEEMQRRWSEPRWIEAMAYVENSLNAALVAG